MKIIYKLRNEVMPAVVGYVDFSNENLTSQWRKKGFFNSVEDEELRYF